MIFPQRKVVLSADETCLDTSPDVHPAFFCSCGFFANSTPDYALVDSERESKRLGSGDSTVQVWLLADELHTILVFPHDWLIESGFIPPENFKRGKNVAVSWGGRQAMIKDEGLNLPETLAALYLPSSTVVECVPVDRPMVEVPARFRVWTKNTVSADQGPAVAAFLNHSVIRDSNGKPKVMMKSSWGNGLLLESPHTYHFPKMCNSWTSQGLTAAGTKVNPIMAIFPDSVIGRAQRDGYVQVREASVETTPSPSR